MSSISCALWNLFGIGTVTSRKRFISLTELQEPSLYVRQYFELTAQYRLVSITLMPFPSQFECMVSTFPHKHKSYYFSLVIRYIELHSDSEHYWYMVRSWRYIACSC